MNPPSLPTQPRWRDARFGGCVSARVEQVAADDTRVVSTEALHDYPVRLTDRFEQWAAQAPQRVLVARRGADGAWQTVSYQQMLARVRALGQALVDRGLGADRPVAILSGNSIEHFTLALACQWVGVPHTPVSPAYALQSSDFGKLRHIMAKLEPGLVFADDASRFARAIDAAIDARVEVMAVTGSAGRVLTSFSDLLQTVAGPTAQAAHDAVNADTVVKVLFTSGSTSMPKGVITTQRMLCANQQMLAQCLPFLTEAPPVLVDWLPWNHTFGGSHNVGIVLYHGGTMYIDDGKPVPGLIDETLRNLREISPTIYFNVPKGFEEIASAMASDEALARRLLAKVRCFFYSGAALSQPVWDSLDATAERIVGERIPIITGLGMTETAPSDTFAVGTRVQAGDIGLPCPGVEVRLVPLEGKTEIRFRGPNLMPGYWREPELSQAAFDEQGFYRTGDAVTWKDPTDPQRGLRFDGRIAEDFKLSSGTFVSVGPLRARVIHDGAPIVQDVIVTGLNRDDIGLLVFVRADECARLLASPGADLRTMLTSPRLSDWFGALLARQYAAGTGSSTRVARLMLMTEPPSIDVGEITDKGSFNQRAVLAHRAALVEKLHSPQADQDPLVHVIRQAP